jgi:hypothetical protein
MKRKDFLKAFLLLPFGIHEDNIKSPTKEDNKPVRISFSDCELKFKGSDLTAVFKKYGD